MAEAALRYAAYLDGDLSDHLRVHLFWLEERRSPTAVDRRPQL
ncbi:hypothetical protein ACIOMM_29500 [Streptomyces sp. NPDC087908]|nr:hypothetical protein [Streptomyces sp. adm13(2018)]